MRGVTIACLKAEEKQPCLKDKLASLAIMSAKTDEQDCIKEVGMKSKGQDLPGMLESKQTISEAETGGMSTSVGPE